MSGLRDRLHKASRRVEVVRLSSELPAHVDLLKLDVEGMEWDVLEDLVEAGALPRIDRLAVEYHHHLPASSNRLSEFVGILETAGFGYEIAAHRPAGSCGPRYQDVMVYAYRQPGQAS